jgi:hypothetical protein
VNEIGNALGVLDGDPTSDTILRYTLEVCNKTNVTEEQQILFTKLCSIFRKCSVDFIGSRHVVDVMSVWWRISIIQQQHQWASTLVWDQALLQG